MAVAQHAVSTRAVGQLDVEAHGASVEQVPALRREQTVDPRAGEASLIIGTCFWGCDRARTWPASLLLLGSRMESKLGKLRSPTLSGSSSHWRLQSAS